MHRRRGSTAVCALVALLLGTAHDSRADAWPQGDWSNRVRITVRPEFLPDGVTLEGITLALALDGAAFADVLDTARPDGADLMVTGPDGVTRLPHELVRFDPLAGAGELWFRADVLSADDRGFFLYYGHPDTSLVSEPGDAWGAEYLGVYHFEEDPSLGVLGDSGPGNAPGSSQSDQANWAASDRIDGIIGRGWLFDGVDNYVFVPNMSSGDSTFTISTWYADTPGSPLGSLAFQSVSGFWNASFERSGQIPHADLETSAGFITWEPELGTGGAHHFVWVLDGVNDVARLFIDGVEQLVQVEYRYDPAVPVYTGESIDGRIGIAGPAWFNELDLSAGIVDEYRVLEGARDAAWLAVEHANQADPHAFFEYLTEASPNSATSATAQDFVTRTSQVRAHPNPFRGVTELSVDLVGAPVKLGVYDVAGRLVRILEPRSVFEGRMQTQWNGRDDRGSLVAKGLYLVRPLNVESAATTKVLYLR